MGSTQPPNRGCKTWIASLSSHLPPNRRHALRNRCPHQANRVPRLGHIRTGKTHPGIAVARTHIRNGTRGRFFNVVDLVNRLETETHSEKQGRTADCLTRMDPVIILDTRGHASAVADQAVTWRDEGKQTAH